MGASVPPKQFSGPGVVLSPDQQQNVVNPAAALPKQPLNPFLQMNTTSAGMYAAPNATPSPLPAGINNNPAAKYPLQYAFPGATAQ